MAEQDERHCAHSINTLIHDRNQYTYLLSHVMSLYIAKSMKEQMSHNAEHMSC